MTDWTPPVYDEGGLPIHLPMLVTAEGRGPCDDSDPDAHHYVCWCNTECSWQIALHHNALSPGDREYYRNRNE